MIISVMESFLHNTSQSMLELVKCYPTIEHTDEEGEKRMEIMNRYFLMYGQHPPGRSKEDIVLVTYYSEFIINPLGFQEHKSIA